MPSRLRRLQIEWNELVPQGQARGLRVQTVALYPEGLHERIPHRQRRIDWLRNELGLTTVLAQVATPAQVTNVGLGASTDSPFTFGVELELLLPRGMSYAQLARRVSDAGVDCRSEGYNHQVRTFWKIVSDASVRGDRPHHGEGAELVSPVLSGDAGLAQVDKVCRVLTEAGCTVNRTCGLHVHVGARNESIGFFRNLVTLYANAEPIIDTFMAPSRRASANYFCRGLTLDRVALTRATNLNEVAAALRQSGGLYNTRGSGRYCKLNLQSFWQHGTVEFRQHQGTVESAKVLNWVRFCLRMALAARKETVTLDNTLEALLTTLGATEEETTYFTGRVAHFNNLTGANRRVA